MSRVVRTLFQISLFVCWPAHAESPLGQALALTREKHYAEARKILEGVSEPAQLNARIAFHRLKAAIASGLKQNSTAADEMRAALALSPGDRGLTIATAVAEFEAGRLEDALQHARQSGNTPDANALMGDIYERRGQFADAAQAYREAAALAPDQEQYRITLGFELIRHQASPAAVQMLQQSASQFPKSARIRLLLGIAQFSEGYTEEAVQTLNDAIALDPKLDAAYRCLAQIILQSSAAPLKLFFPTQI